LDEEKCVWASAFSQRRLDKMDAITSQRDTAVKEVAAAKARLEAMAVSVARAEAAKAELTAAADALTKAEADAAEAAEAMTRLEAALRDSQEELAGVEATLAQREAELEHFVPKHQLTKVVESNELKVRLMQTELAEARAELQEARRLRQSQEQAASQSTAATAAAEKLREQVRELNRQLTQQASSATAARRELEARAAAREAETAAEVEARENAGAAERAMLGEQLAAAEKKYIELQGSFNGWRERARQMLDERDAVVQALKAKLKAGGSNAGAAAASVSAGVDTHSAAAAFTQATQRVADGDTSVDLGGEAAAAAAPFSGVAAAVEAGDALGVIGSSPDKQVDLQYLRNVVVKYLSTPATEYTTRERLLPLIAVLLELKPQELTTYVPLSCFSPALGHVSGPRVTQRSLSVACSWRCGTQSEKGARASVEPGAAERPGIHSCRGHVALVRSLMRRSSACVLT
jgi:hypothetical protein